MIVSCPQCAARFRVGEAQIAGRTRVRVRCTRCQSVFSANVTDGDGTARGEPTGSHSVVPALLQAVPTQAAPAVPLEPATMQVVPSDAVPRGGLPAGFEAGRPLVESGAVPALGAAGPSVRPALPAPPAQAAYQPATVPVMQPATVSMLPPRPQLSGGGVPAQGLSPSGPLPAFGAAAGPGLAVGRPSGQLPAFGGARISVPPGGGLPSFGGMPSEPASLPPATGQAVLPAMSGVVGSIEEPTRAVVGQVPLGPRHAVRSATTGGPGFGTDAGPTGPTGFASAASAMPTMGGGHGIGASRATSAAPAGVAPTMFGAPGSGASQGLSGAFQVEPSAAANVLMGSAGQNAVVTRPNPAVPADPLGDSQVAAFLGAMDVGRVESRGNSLRAEFGAGDLFGSVRGAPSPDNEVPTRLIDLADLDGPPLGGNQRPAASGIDPLVEFRDVFRDAGARATESELRRYVEATARGDNRGARAPIDAPEGFSGRSGLLDVAVGSTEPPLSSGPPPALTEESALLDIALKASGMAEPAADPAEVAAKAERARVKGLDIAGDAARRDAVAGGAAPTWVAVVLAGLFGCVVFLGWLASKNDGLLDLRELDQMIGVAFRGEIYVPRAVRIVSVAEGSERWADAMEGDSASRPPLEIGDVSTGRYVTRGGAALIVVAGTVFNRSSASLRAISVDVDLLDDAGRVAATVSAPAGSEVSEGELEQLDHDELDDVYDSIRARTAALEIAPGASTRFTGIFAVPDSAAAAGFSWRARPAAAQKRVEAETCWSEFTFAPTLEGDVDSATGPLDGVSMAREGSEPSVDAAATEP